MAGRGVVASYEERLYPTDWDAETDQDIDLLPTAYYPARQLADVHSSSRSCRRIPPRTNRERLCPGGRVSLHKRGALRGPSPWVLGNERWWLSARGTWPGPRTPCRCCASFSHNWGLFILCLLYAHGDHLQQTQTVILWCPVGFHKVSV
ncbi:hypothetical protein CGRA01v4_03592 [Colletotrichum graminicola]|nr:hypothetical protein CGRA01v4_03592 [Colletotrichum graminicola]